MLKSIQVVGSLINDHCGMHVRRVMSNRDNMKLAKSDGGLGSSAFGPLRLLLKNMLFDNVAMLNGKRSLESF